MAPSALPITEVLITAECWQAEPEAEAVIDRAIAAAAGDSHAGKMALSGGFCEASVSLIVMAGLVPAIHAFDARFKTGMPATSAGMTV